MTNYSTDLRDSPLKLTDFIILHAGLKALGMLHLYPTGRLGVSGILGILGVFS